MVERALIIGAGAAGLAAAGELAKAGLQPLVLEARPRTGGRIHTLSDGEHAPSELGAEFLHGLSPEIERLAREHHLAMREVSDEHWRIRSGVFEAMPDFWEKLERVFEAIPERGRDRPYTDAQFHDWRKDSFARGAYSYVPVGGLDARDILARPAQRTLFFAGEAIASVGTQGTVHGAVASGLRAARAVLDTRRRHD